MSWVDDLDDEDRAGWDKFVAYQREHTLKAMIESAMVISLVPSTEEFDIKFAVETGMAIMLDKPILAIVAPGGTIPPKLLRVADHVLYDIDLDTESGRLRVETAIKEIGL